VANPDKTQFGLVRQAQRKLKRGGRKINGKRPRGQKETNKRKHPKKNLFAGYRTKGGGGSNRERHHVTRERKKPKKKFKMKGKGGLVVE